VTGPTDDEDDGTPFECDDPECPWCDGRCDECLLGETPCPAHAE